MRPKNPNAWFGILLVGSGVFASAQSWEMSLGPAARFGQEIQITGSSSTQAAGLTAGLPFQNDPASVGSVSASANRTYADGFVFRDGGTDNPLAVGGPGLTWNWGYNNATQFNNATNTLAFTQQGGDRRIREILRNDAVAASERFASYGARIDLLRAVESGERGRIALQAGVMILTGSANGIGSSPYAEFHTRSSYAVTDRYNATGITVPAAPYSGTYDGPGTVISNLPASRERTQTAITETFSAANTVTFDVDALSLDVSFGPRVTFTRWERAEVFVLPALVAGYQWVDVARRERFTTSGGSVLLREDSDASDSALRLGVSLDVGASVDLTDRWVLTVLAGYLAATGDVDVEAGPNEVTVSPSGFQASLGLNFTF
jgi:hypothetical protein